MSRYFTLALLCLLLLPGVCVWAQTSGLDPAFQTLSAGNVYVDPRLPNINQQELEQAAMQAQGNPHTVVKIALLALLPSKYRSRDQYAEKLHLELGLGKNGLVVIIFRGRGAGVAVVTPGLNRDEARSLTQQYAHQIAANPTNGTAQLAEAVAGKINGKEYRSTTALWIFFLIVVIVISWLVISASKRRKQQLAEARRPIDALRGNVLSGIEYLDGYADVLPKNNPDSDQVRINRQAASNKYEQAVKILDRATEMTDLNRAQGLLDRAQADVQTARRALDRATGGTGNIPGDDAMRPEPIPESQSAVSAIPQNQRGVSFFSGQPAPVSALVPVTITVNNQSRQVLVTPEEADEMRQGRMPQVRSFQNGNQYVPWYEYNNYDPYRDYWGYQHSGWNSFATGFIAADMLESLTQPHYMGGYAPGYAFATDMPYYQGYAQQSPDFGSSQGYNDVGSTDFMTNSNDTSGYDNSQNYNDVGSTDFLSSGNDNGGSDFGGGDFGGGDSGGGSDF